MRHFQQGDVLLKVIDAIPNNAVKQGHKALQVSAGSTNSHRFDADAKAWLYEDAAGAKFLLVEEPAMLRHEEHKHFEVPAGAFAIDLVREQDYDTDEMRRVVD